MQRLLALTIVALIALAATVQPASAWAGPFAGRPGKLGPGSPTGFYLWGAGDALHLRSSSTAGANEYSGRVTTDGRITYLHKVGTEGRDSVTQSGQAQIDFFFVTYDVNDGFDMEVAGGTYVTFELLLNGAPIATDRIHIGARGVHPDGNPVVITR